MKSLGAMIAVTLLAIPMVGTSAPAGNENVIDPYMLEIIRASEEITGHHVDLSNAQLLGEQAFTMPVDAVGVEAAMDLATGDFTVGLLWAVPDTTGQSGCIVPQGSVPGYGWTKDGVPMGDTNSACPPPLGFEHPGGILSEKLICLNATEDCFVYAVGVAFDPFSVEYMYISCLFGSVVIAQQVAPAPNGPTPGAITNGVCNSYGFASNGFGQAPYYGIVGGRPPGPNTLTVGLVNI